MRTRLFLLLLGASSVLTACAEAGGAGPEIGLGVSYIGMDAPDDLACVRLFISESGGPPQELSAHNLASLEDSDGDGGPELALQESLMPAAGTPFEIVVQGYTSENCPGEGAYVARSGVLRLQPGERRFVEMAFYSAGEVEPLLRGDTPEGTVLPTATALPDGRVLLAGGFALEEGECPTGVSTGTCYEGTATSDAWIFDPPTGRFFPVQGGMGAARGGHTATPLDDGRVLIAGGAGAMRLAFVPSAGGGASLVAIEPRDAEGEIGAHDTFEIFEPDANPELPEDDLLRDGDPGRGGFVGRADDPGTLAPLNGPRFLHAAAHAGDGVVVLAGGMGGDASTTFETFDARRPGGYGVYDNTGALLRATRVAPSAVAVRLGSGEPRIWIVGGTVARSNDDLAEIWSPSAEVPTGVTVAGTTAPGFPAPVDAGGAKPPMPGFALIRPQVAPLDNGATAMVNGWYGPRCAPGASVPFFPADGEPQELCGRGDDERSFNIRAEDGRTVSWQPSSGRFQAFSAVAVLPSGRVAVTGGMSDEMLTTTNDLTLYQATTSDDGLPVSLGLLRLDKSRAFHAAAGLRGEGLMVFGGLTLTSTTVGVPSQAAEAFFL